MSEVEYGIRHRRTGEMHRERLTREQAREFMDPAEWDGIDPTRIYEVVRRPLGTWRKVILQTPQEEEK